MKSSLLAVLFVLSCITTHAHEADKVNPEEFNLRLLKTIELEGGTVVYITARDQGHVLGQPFVIETRVSCKGRDEDLKRLKVHDSYSVCDMEPHSIVVNRQNTAVAMKSKAADIDSYYQSIAGGKTPSEVSCQEKTELLKFSLKNLCTKAIAH